MKQSRPLNNRHTPFLACVLASRLTDRAPFFSAPQPHQKDAVQVSMRIPVVYEALNKERVLLATLEDTGNSNPTLRVHKNYNLHGNLGNCEQ